MSWQAIGQALDLDQGNDPKTGYELAVSRLRDSDRRAGHLPAADPGMAAARAAPRPSPITAPTKATPKTTSAATPTIASAWPPKSPPTAARWRNGTPNGRQSDRQTGQPQPGRPGRREAAEPRTDSGPAR